MKQISTLKKIQHKLFAFSSKYGRDPLTIELIAVTKNQPPEKIETLLQEGQRLFAENRIQEAMLKWIPLKEHYRDCILHLIGHLQTNKAKEAIMLFDVIQTLDSVKLARKLSLEEERQNKQLIYYIEINIGSEPQKNGVLPEDFPYFYEKLCREYPLNIKGVMCIPPKNCDPSPYFQRLKNIAIQFNLPHISMGMSDDYELAIKQGATEVRIGRALFDF